MYFDDVPYQCLVACFEVVQEWLILVFYLKNTQNLPKYKALSTHIGAYDDCMEVYLHVIEAMQ